MPLTDLARDVVLEPSVCNFNGGSGCTVALSWSQRADDDHQSTRHQKQVQAEWSKVVYIANQNESVKDEI